jgi:hypothetical protein
MIQGFSDYETTETNTFSGKERLKLGGHICKILEASVETMTSKKDGKTFNMLKLKFDIEAPDEQAGFYQRKFVEDAKTDALNAKWKGYYRLTIPDNSSEDFSKKNWKTFITSIEESNAGVKINGAVGFDENILVGKVFGGIFGLEEFTLPTDGRTITFTRLKFARSTKNISEAKIPSVKLLDGTYMDYGEYKAKRKAEREAEKAGNNVSTEQGVINSENDLPF